MDPRKLGVTGLPDLIREMPPRTEVCDLESDAVLAVRALYPDALAMPLPLPVGSGEVLLLGILPDLNAPRDPNSEIRFVLFVHAVPENAGDRRVNHRKQQFSRHAWKPPVVLPEPTTVRIHPVELRASDLEMPVSISAIVGRRRGSDGRSHLTIRCEVGGIAMSMVFQDPDIQLEQHPPDPNVTFVQITTAKEIL